MIKVFYNYPEALSFLFKKELQLGFVVAVKLKNKIWMEKPQLTFRRYR